MDQDKFSQKFPFTPFYRLMSFFLCLMGGRKVVKRLSAIGYLLCNALVLYCLCSLVARLNNDGIVSLCRGLAF